MKEDLKECKMSSVLLSMYVHGWLDGHVREFINAARHTHTYTLYIKKHSGKIYILKAQDTHIIIIRNRQYTVCLHTVVQSYDHTVRP